MAAPVTVMHARAGKWLRITLCLLACLLACLPLKSVDAQTRERERTKVCVIIRTRMKHRTESKRNGKQNRKSLFKLCSARFSANRVVSECDR